jgi:hypothetical protein
MESNQENQDLPTSMGQSGNESEDNADMGQQESNLLDDTEGGGTQVSSEGVGGGDSGESGSESSDGTTGIDTDNLNAGSAAEE